MKKVLFTFLAIILLGVGAILWFFQSDTLNPYAPYQWGRFSGICEDQEPPGEDYGKNIAACDYTVPREIIPSFSEIPFPFENAFDNTRSLPMMASAMIDIDNDGVDEVFMGGGVSQEDALFKYTSHGFIDISSSAGLPQKPEKTTTYGSVSIDLDKDGLTDLLLTGDYGLLWYRNNVKGFESRKIEVSLDEKSTAATTTVGDFNNDGHADIFLCTYIKLDKMEGQTIFKNPAYGSISVLLQNNGDNTFTDVTKSAGLEYVHNTFQAVFVDIDRDGRIDLVVAYDTGEVRTYRNTDGQHFKSMPNPLTGKFAYPMGIGVGDYNNDGRMDFFFSNTGTSVPTFLARGDLAKDDIFNSKWILFRNDGDFKFTDVAAETKVADFEFSWGAVFQDFNLDGLQDLVVAENYVDFPPHKLFKLPCRFLIQRPGGTFAAVEEQAGVVNKLYAVTPLTSDFNGDGYPDLIYTNLDGPVKAFINAGGSQYYVGVRFPENSDYIGAIVTVILSDDQFLSDVYVTGEGLGSDQAATLSFGLGHQKSVRSINIRFPDGTEKVISNPAINQIHFVDKKI
jgi:hypothetical protein